ncbi:SdiA-regulated domain-containing protein [Chitinophagaceae bacterium LB-8]|uniref:SdiA-regulated domain-containing protein n=1 Tax=Paraflavisolibacter caeni TaxID=2982496 RepID=A0A9X3BGK7_9BACT|nr:SdiA-regulated domain-containing protein [Paraflavisolibacter caeni]MCU7551109.1 SdiA-regulated domain-containing protein [Paraflavisolibacter caeni]
MLLEVSGIADSKKNPGYLWAQEDSDNPPNLILISHEGNVVKTIPIKDAINYDWEDMTLAGDQIYIADIGDNKLERNEYTIYQFTEPSSSVNLIESFKTIRFKYPDGTHDAEALLVDPVKKDIYLITKRDNPSEIYKLSYPQSFTELNTATKVGSLSYSGVVSASLSADAKNIIIKTYIGLHLYRRNESEDITKILAGPFTNLDYHIEPQGEAVAFAADNSGFYTLSEKGFSKDVNLYFYRKK